MSGTRTDAGTWRLVARRDFWVRLRERSFLISTLINVVVISILILIRAYGGGGTTSFDVGVVGNDPIAPKLEALESAGVRVAVVRFPDGPAAERAVLDGSVDAAVVGDQIIGKSSVAQSLQDVVQVAAFFVRLDDVIARYDVTGNDQSTLRNQHPLDVAVLERGDPNRGTNAAIAFVGVILLYGQLFGYGVWVATGVIEEKSSRVVELLLSTIRARQLMAGKIFGIGLLGLVQLTIVGGFAITLATITGAIDLPSHAVGAALLDVGWFVLGFAFYAGLFAAAGALVSRMEELQNVIVPINLVILVSFFISIGALQDPDGTVVRVASILPTSSALAMPVRIVLGAASPLEIVLSIALALGSIALLVPLSGRLYAGAVLRTGGRVKLRDAWRSAA